MKGKNVRNSQRDKEIFKLRQKGATFSELGRKYKVSSERVRHIYFREKERRNSE